MDYELEPGLLKLVISAPVSKYLHRKPHTYVMRFLTAKSSISLTDGD